MKEPKIFRKQNLSEKVHYVYRVTIDEKYYIGKRTGRLDDLKTGAYKTSSKLVKEKLQNGHHFSKIKILQVFSSSKDALEFEKRILIRVNARKNPKFLNQHNGGGNYTLKQHTQKSKKKMSKKAKEQFDPNTEQGRKNLANHRNLGLKQFDPNTELGRKRREHMSNKRKEYFNPETELGRKNLENFSKKQKERFNPETEQGRRNLKKRAQISKAQFDPNTESGRRNLKKRAQISLAIFDKNTESGRKRREHMSNKRKEYFNPETELGRKRREHMSNKRKEKAKEHIQNRKNASILGDLMFDEDFIKENFLIIDDKNNQRFLWSVYSKLTGYSKSYIKALKQDGKLSFLYGIKSISITEELENSKIKEIEAIIKSRNEKE